jgi:hypothetical protein
MRNQHGSDDEKEKSDQDIAFEIGLRQAATFTAVGEGRRGSHAGLVEGHRLTAWQRRQYRAGHG